MGLNTTGGVSFTLSAGDTSTIGGLGEVSDFTYNTIALTLHSAIVGSAMLIEDVGILFDFISTFGITLLMYILPAAFLLLTMKKFQRKSQRNTFESKLYKLTAWVILAVGLISCLLGMRVCLHNITGQ